ncbi:DUF3301 domain-containing protein [Aerosticca soli]|uniref:DUF3301 domain-containing protein n=1 Tax=Aerosticca soli TaxID=2010829 RepID=A0A2Z6E6G4_9GAMM|nr:DUF3301 domain-containing protein [Aerosticca soli]BBD80079.1 hypothetical protein ALSL_1422 [Aerosticca soli]
MGNAFDFVLLLLVAGIAAAWLALTRMREHAGAEVRRQCRRRGLQLLDDSIGWRVVRLRRVQGRFHLACRYDFEVSMDGADRARGSLWMTAAGPAGITLPERPEAALPPSETLPDNVIPLRPRRREGQHH